MALAQPAEGQIVYTPDRRTIGPNRTMTIDLNHDGITDVTIREIPWAYGASRYPGNSVQAVPRPGDRIQVGTQGSIYAAAVLAGSEIGDSGPFRRGAVVMLRAIDPDGTYYFGYWLTGPEYRFLGIRFRFGGEVHYGWARLDVTVLYGRGIRAKLSGYACETQPNKPIRAGDTGRDDSEEMLKDQMFLPLKPEARQQCSLGALALGATYRSGATRSGDDRKNSE
jgi:hypothetical protein